jgi:hypothetical protein
MCLDALNEAQRAHKEWYLAFTEQRAFGAFKYHGDEIIEENGPMRTAVSSDTALQELLLLGGGAISQWKEKKLGSLLPSVPLEATQKRLAEALFGRNDITKYRDAAAQKLTMQASERQAMNQKKDHFNALWEKARRSIKAARSLSGSLASPAISKSTLRRDDLLDLYRFAPRLDEDLQNLPGLREAHEVIDDHSLFAKASNAVLTGYIVEHPRLVAVASNIYRVKDEFGSFDFVDRASRQLIDFMDRKSVDLIDQKVGLSASDIATIQADCLHTDNRTTAEEEWTFARNGGLPDRMRLYRAVCSACKFLRQDDIEKTLECLSLIEAELDTCDEHTQGMWKIHHGRILLRTLRSRQSYEHALSLFEESERLLTLSSTTHAFLPHARFYQALAHRQLGRDDVAEKLLASSSSEIRAGVGQSCLRPFDDFGR